MEKKEGFFGVLKNIFAGKLVSRLIELFREEAKLTLKKAQEVAYHVQDIVIKEILASIGVLLATIFILIGITFLIIEYANISKGFSFLIVGLVVLIASLLYKAHIEKGKILEVKYK
ncbi:hypothetical protein ACFL0W_03915 [Nanoarchaeota archaeon]